MFIQYDSYKNNESPGPFIPDEYELILGRAIIAFSSLDVQLLVAIASLLTVDDYEAESIVAEMSFKNRINLFSSLMKLRLSDTEFNFGKHDPKVALSELISVCLKAEELRNKLIHSQWDLEPTTQKVRRRKTTSKASSGLKFQYEYAELSELNRIVNYILYATTCIGDVFNHFTDFKVRNRTA
ncbi:MAG: hypothetical protein NTX44_05135 [Ignavibacteriales bacterium]|nr:hypothetical protein [Ignavibacteriales bacterium]